MKIYRGKRGVAPLILNLGTRRRPGCFTPNKMALVPAELDFVLAAHPV